MRVIIFFEIITYRFRRLPCVLFGWSVRFPHTNASCRGRIQCGERMQR